MITHVTGAIKRPQMMITNDTKMITHATGGQTADGGTGRYVLPFQGG